MSLGQASFSFWSFWVNNELINMQPWPAEILLTQLVNSPGILAQMSGREADSSKRTSLKQVWSFSIFISGTKGNRECWAESLTLNMSRFKRVTALTYRQVPYIIMIPMNGLHSNDSPTHLSFCTEINGPKLVMSMNFNGFIPSMISIGYNPLRLLWLTSGVR